MLRGLSEITRRLIEHKASRSARVLKRANSTPNSTAVFMATTTISSRLRKISAIRSSQVLWARYVPQPLFVIQQESTITLSAARTGTRQAGATSETVASSSMIVLITSQDGSSTKSLKQSRSANN